MMGCVDLFPVGDTDMIDPFCDWTDLVEHVEELSLLTSVWPENKIGKIIYILFNQCARFLTSVTKVTMVSTDRDFSVLHQGCKTSYTHLLWPNSFCIESYHNID